MRILSIRAVILTPSKKIKMKIFLTQNPFLNKTRGCRAEISNSKTMTISCQCIFKALHDISNNAISLVNQISNIKS